MADSIPAGGPVKTFDDEFMAALALHQAGRIDEAVLIYEKLLQTQPENPQALHYMGVGCYQRGQLEAAARYVREAIALSEHEPMAHNNLGLICKQLNQLDEALACFDRALTQDPDNALAYNNRGLVLHDQKRLDDAANDFRQAIGLRDDFAEAHANLAQTLLSQKRFQEALIACERALSLAPGIATTQAIHGSVLRELKQPETALASWDKALAINPEFAEVYANRASALRDLRRHDEEAASLDRAMSLKPGMPYLFGDWIHSRLQLCQWQDFDAHRKQLLTAIDNGKSVADPFTLMKLDSDAARQQRCAALVTRDRAPVSATPLWRGERYTHERIRVAYVSADFRDHPTTHLMAGLIEGHDRAQFDVFAFYIGPPGADAWHARMQTAFDRFLDVATQSDDEIAALIRSHEIDIAVDLMGHTAYARSGVFAKRPAPVQVNYLGFPGTMGAPYIDYLIGDTTVISASSRPFYDERIASLPHSYQVNDATKVIADDAQDRRTHGLPERAFVFCCFNGSIKITPDVFDVWMRLLKRVEGSVLWLMGEQVTAMNNLRREAEQRGVSGDRLLFAPRQPLAMHLARHRCADLFVDTFHYNAHTTASDALWAGLPVLTCSGESFASRVAGSLLGAVSLPELITQDPAHYEQTAFELATQPDRLRAIRDKLARQRASQPLFNTVLYTRHLESAYRAMHARQQSGLPPEDIVIST